MAIHKKSLSKPNIDLSKKRVAVLGAGKLGGMLLQALLREGLLSKESTRATVRHPERVAALADKPRQCGVRT
jgi:pyrroline-5-carboxylate reductase